MLNVANYNPRRYHVTWAGAWAYKSTRMNLTNLSEVVETQEFKINGEWHMRGTKAEWNEVVLPQHPDIRYSKVSPLLWYSYTIYVVKFELYELWLKWNKVHKVQKCGNVAFQELTNTNECLDEGIKPVYPAVYKKDELSQRWLRDAPCIITRVPEYGHGYFFRNF